MKGRGRERDWQENQCGHRVLCIIQRKAELHRKFISEAKYQSDELEYVKRKKKPPGF